MLVNLKIPLNANNIVIWCANITKKIYKSRQSTRRRLNTLNLHLNIFGAHGRLMLNIKILFI